jgi:hypothetical protein
VPAENDAVQKARVRDLDPDHPSSREELFSEADPSFPDSGAVGCCPVGPYGWVGWRATGQSDTRRTAEPGSKERSLFPRQAGCWHPNPYGWRGFLAVPRLVGYGVP